MRKEYDFSKGERGRFYRPDATLNLPVYLDQEVRAYVHERARAKGIEVRRLVNDILRREIDPIEAVK